MLIDTNFLVRSTRAPGSLVLSVLLLLVSATSILAQPAWKPSNEGISGGDVRCFAFDRKGTAYVGTPIGIYRLAKGAAEWKHLTDAMCVDALTVTRAGTMLSAAEGRIYRSSDAGTSWARVHEGNGVVEFATTNRGSLLAGGDKAYFRSTDDGKTWSRLEGIKRVRRYLDFPSIAVGFEDTVVVITDDRLVWSTDDGATWKPAVQQCHGQTASFASDGSLVVARRDVLSVHDIEGKWRWGGRTQADRLLRDSSGQLLALVAGWFMPPRERDNGIHVSRDNGTNWSNALLGSFRHLAIAPDGSYWAHDGSRVLVSSDRGRTWLDRTKGLKNIFVKRLASDDAGRLYALVKHGMIDPQNERQTSLYTLYRSDDDGGSWKQMLDSVSDLVHADGSGLVMVTRSVLRRVPGEFAERHVLYSSSDHGTRWRAIPGQEWHKMLSSPTPGYVAALSVVDTNYGRGEARLAITRDSGRTWSDIDLSGSVGAIYYCEGGVLLADIAYDHHKRRERGQHRSTDFGATWTHTPSEVNNREIVRDADGTLIGIGFVPPTNSVCRLSISTDIGVTWHTLYEGRLRFSTIVPVSPRILLGRSNVHWFRSTDSGASWDTLRVADGWAKHVNAIEMESDGSLVVEVVDSTDWSRWMRSTDSGESWRPLTHGVPWRDLPKEWFYTFRTQPSIVRSSRGAWLAATMGYGIWRLPPQKETPGEPARSRLVLDTPSPATFSSKSIIGFSSSQGGHVRLTVVSPTGSTVGTLVDGELPAGAHERMWRPGPVPPGRYEVVLEAGGERVTKVAVVL